MKNANRNRPTSSAAKKNRPLAQLRARRRELAREIEKVDVKISRLGPQPRLTVAKLDRLLDQLSEGIKGGPHLPPDFSRADIYEDHD